MKKWEKNEDKNWNTTQKKGCGIIVNCHSPPQPQPQFNLKMSWELHDNG
jgi:hypothetical protein